MKYDVVIVGAGPSGSTAAKNLAENGKKVLIIDKQKFPRDKSCGGGIPTRVMKQFPYIKAFIDSISYGSYTHSSSLKYTLKFVTDKPFLVTVIRKDFDDGLVKLAVNAGATFLNSTAVKDVTIQKDKVALLLDDNKKIEAEIVLGCDGIRSIVAEKTDLCKKMDEICTCVVQEQRMDEQQLHKYFTDKKIVHLFIKTQGIAGYGWIFPKKKHINIGMGQFESAVDSSKPKTNLKESYEKYIKLLKEKKMLPLDFPIENVKGGLLPVFPLKKTYSERVLLCGDAAGFINSITGEGIYYAMASGEIAANVASESIDSDDMSCEFLSKYQELWYDKFGKDLKCLGRFNKMWGTDSEKIVRLLSKDQKFAKLIIGVTGGRVSISKYKTALITRYIYVLIKDFFSKKLGK
jgi:geranylgeranyl reductase family protein